MSEPVDLNGKRIVVVEDDFILATDISRQLRSLGATVLGPAPTPFYAMQLINKNRIDAAVLDVRLHGTMVFEVADRLVAQGVPLLFASAFSQTEMPVRFRNALWLEKPVDTILLAEKLHELICAPARHSSRPAPLQMVPSRWTPTQAFARALCVKFGAASST